MLGRRVAESGGISVDDQDHLTQLNWLLPGKSSSDVAEKQRLQQNRVAAPLASLVLSSADATALVASQPAPPTGSLSPNLHLQSLDRVGLEYTPAAEAGKTLLRIRHVFHVCSIARVNCINFVGPNLDTCGTHVFRKARVKTTAWQNYKVLARY